MGYQAPERQEYLAKTALRLDTPKNERHPPPHRGRCQGVAKTAVAAGLEPLFRQQHYLSSHSYVTKTEGDRGQRRHGEHDARAVGCPHLLASLANLGNRRVQLQPRRQLADNACRPVSTVQHRVRACTPTMQTPTAGEHDNTALGRLCGRADAVQTYV